jgi:hypothetical protein
VDETLYKSLRMILDPDLDVDDLELMMGIDVERCEQRIILFFTCIGKEKYYYVCTLLLFLEKKGSVLKLCEQPFPLCSALAACAALFRCSVVCPMRLLLCAALLAACCVYLTSGAWLYAASLISAIALLLWGGAAFSARLGGASLRPRPALFAQHTKRYLPFTYVTSSLPLSVRRTATVRVQVRAAGVR